MPVDIASLPEGSTFRCPWRRPGADVGKILRIGPGSIHVHAANQEGTGWETSHWSPSTAVEPCPEELYHRQSFGTGAGRLRNRSDAESPVQTVHRICDEMEGADRKDVIAACVEAGVNINTAKTQYYHWKKNQ